MYLFGCPSLVHFNLFVMLGRLNHTQPRKAVRSRDCCGGRRARAGLLGLPGIVRATVPPRFASTRCRACGATPWTLPTVTATTATMTLTWCVVLFSASFTPAPSLVCPASVFRLCCGEPPPSVPRCWQGIEDGARLLPEDAVFEIPPECYEFHNEFAIDDHSAGMSFVCQRVPALACVAGASRVHVCIPPPFLTPPLPTICNIFQWKRAEVWTARWAR